MRPKQMPFSDTPSVLSDRPLFVWRTPVARVQVQLAKNKQVVWNQILPEGTQRVVYQGQPLEAGKTYQVIAFGRQGDPLNVGEDAQFTLLSTDEREEMLQRLMALETDLDNQQKSAETIAIAKAIELSNSSLFSDAYQVLDALPQKSPQLTNFLANLPASICGKQYEAGSFRLPNTTN
ncbi:MAG TPA: hypothetical protein IGS53_28090 [Leptolyngbyaceae cyanobacterium M33_DOE_097]|nr:hypothetical protein [Leptolyngbyaceae cyanobacterium M33_DOE_097]